MLEKKEIGEQRDRIEQLAEALKHLTCKLFRTKVSHCEGKCKPVVYFIIIGIEYIIHIFGNNDEIIKRSDNNRYF